MGIDDAKERAKARTFAGCRKGVGDIVADGVIYLGVVATVDAPPVTCVTRNR